MANTDNPLKLHGDPGRILHADEDQNLLNLMRFAGEWAAGSYKKNQVVTHLGGSWIAHVETLTEPGTGLDWRIVSQPQLIASMFDNSTGPLSITSGWTPIRNYEAESFLPVGITPSLTLGTFQYKFPGIYAANILISIEHDESQQGREIFFRLLNVTDVAVVGGPFAVGIGRNQPATNVTISFYAEVPSSSIGEGVVVEIGGGDTVAVSDASVRYETSSMHVRNV